MATVGGHASVRFGRVLECDAVALLRSQIHGVHQLLDNHVVAATERTKSAPALQREILSLYAHSLCVEDITINLLLRGTSPLFTSTWIGGQLVPWDLTSVRVLSVQAVPFSKVLGSSSGRAARRLGAGSGDLVAPIGLPLASRSRGSLAD